MEPTEADISDAVAVDALFKSALELEPDEAVVELEALQPAIAIANKQLSALVNAGPR